MFRICIPALKRKSLCVQHPKSGPDAERISFINWLASNPEAGDVIPGSGGCRKVRWSRAGMGKRGGAGDLLQPA
jgi:hypothetical protein